ncbi:polysaccharide biosynthesis/export family protein [Chryseobacterium sp. T1]
MRKIYLSLVLGTILSLASCTTKDNINYMRSVDNEIASQVASQSSINTIQPGDQLVITVIAKDDDVVRPFNKNYSSTEGTQYSQPNSNQPTQAQTKASYEPTYIVGSDNNIDFPVIGTIDTKGKTIEQLKEDLKAKISKYVINPTVNIRSNNFKVTILGEVTKPGHIIMPEGQAVTLLAALGMAGDLTIYGERDKVMIIRNVDGQITQQYVDLRSNDFVKSPYYYLKQNDTIVVSANKAKRNSSWFGPQTGIWISVASIIVTILALVLK